MNLTKDIEKNKKVIQELLPIKESFDVIGRDLIIGNVKAYLILIDGFAKDDIMLWILENLQSLPPEKTDIDSIQKFIAGNIGYIEVETFTDLNTMQNMILSGAVGLVLDQQNKGIIIDARTYPARTPSEPDLEKVTRGSRDGLVETIVFNTALIRRRLRDARLIYEMKTVGKRSKTDVAIGYIGDLVNQSLLKKIRTEIDNIQIDSLSMAAKSLEELLIKKKWYNPLPQARFTERPDVVAAHLLEGHIALMVDTSPSVLLLPCTMFHFTQHIEDYYQNPLVGTYIRWVRFFAMACSFILTPLWLLLVFNHNMLPPGLEFIGPKEMGTIPLFIQFIILEIGIDILRIASIHTPNALSTSLGIIGGLLIGQFAVDVGWFIPEAILYMAFVGIGTFATPSLEFAMAIRLFRLLLLVLTGLFHSIGFWVGIGITLLIFLTTKSFGKVRYTWPLIPFNGKAMTNLLFRKPIIQIKRNEQKEKKTRS